MSKPTDHKPARPRRRPPAAHTLTDEERRAGGQALRGKPRMSAAQQAKLEAEAEQLAAAARASEAKRALLKTTVEAILGYLPKDLGEAEDTLGLKREIRMAMALRLRVMGWMHPRIAAVMGISEDQVWDYVNEGMVSIKAYRTLTGEDMRDLANLRLEAILHGVMPNAISGDDKAASAVVRILERQAKLFGLDKPTDIRLLDERAGAGMDSLTDAELDAAEAQARQQAERLRQAVSVLNAPGTETTDADPDDSRE